jgi:enoyl-CoA hydratase/carnithine racemase
MRIDTGTDELLCEIRERVATVMLNRPHKKNSLSDALSPALREVLLTLEAHPDVGCVLLTGAGDAFCSGGDVSGMGGRSAAEPRQPTLDDRVADLIRRQES